MESGENKVFLVKEAESEEIHPTHPAHPHHPSHPDNHPLRVHHPHAPLIRGILGIFLVLVVFLAFFIGLLTNAPFGSVMFSFAPSFLLGVVGLTLLNSDHFDLQYLSIAYLALLVIAGIFIASMLPRVDIFAVIGLNLILGALLLFIVAHSFSHHTLPHHHPKTEHSHVIEIQAEQQDLSKLFESIVEKSKAINVMIGRVYSQYNGGSDAVRDKIRIPRDLYNELDTDKKHVHLQDLLAQIQERLDRLSQAEKDVFTPPQLESLENLERDGSGNSAIIDVISENESGTIHEIYASALEYVRLAQNQVD